MNTPTTTTTTIVAEITTVQMPDGKALVTVWKVPSDRLNDRLDETTDDWDRAGFWVGEDEFGMPEDGFDSDDIDQIVGLIIGVDGDDLDMRLTWEDGLLTSPGGGVAHYQEATA